jgi:transcriptional regulator with XRE-family HTH domain
MNIDLNLLGNNIRLLREHGGLTQAQVAYYLGIEQIVVEQIEQGSFEMNDHLLQNLSYMFFVPIPVLLSNKLSPSFIPEYVETSFNFLNIKQINKDYLERLNNVYGCINE